MLKSMKRKLSDIRNMQIIKKSPYFDKDYYLKMNSDVKENKMDPVKHYYYYGAYEGRNPSACFIQDKYLEMNKSFEIKMNPVVHYMRFGQYDSRIKGPNENICLEKKSITKILNEYFNESIPFKTIPCEIENVRLNIVFNGFDKSCFFGGKATALILAVKCALKNQYILRIIAQDPDPTIFDDFLELFELNRPKDVEFFSTNIGQYLEISKNDHFLCTMWSNADAVLNTPTITGKIFYIMQEVETFFYDHGDYHLRCYNTLTDNRVIPIVNSKLLYNYLCENGYSNVKNNGIYFEPVFSKKLLKPNSKSFCKKEKYKLFYYARPTHQRNIFYFGLENLNEAFLTGKLNPEEWIVYTAGDKNVPDFTFDVDVEIRRLGVMGWKEYCDFMSTIDLCYSMIYTPHPSYPPLDAVTAGAVAVTNKYANKQDLFKYSKNIISTNLNKESMINALEKGGALAKNNEKRKKNWLETKTSGDWDEAFQNSIILIKEKIGEINEPNKE